MGSIISSGRLYDHSTLHDEPDALEEADVLEGISGDRGDVRPLSRLESSRAVRDPDELRRVHRRGADGVDRAHVELLDQDPEVSRVPPVREDGGIRPVRELDARVKG